MTPPYYAFHAAPESTVRTLLAEIEQGEKVCAQLGYRRLLVDLSAVQTRLAEAEFAILGHHTAEHLGAMERIAVLVSGRTGDGERIAQRLGINLFAFTDRTEAEEWLSEPD